MDPVLRVVEVVIGLFLIALFFRSIIVLTLLARPARDPIHDNMVKVMWWAFRLLLSRRADPMSLDRRIIWFWPATVFILMGTWYMLVILGFAFLYSAAGVASTWHSALIASGSALSTLGFRTPPHPVGDLIAVSEAGIGLFLIVYLLSFIPGKLADLRACSDRMAWAYERTGTPITGVRLLEWLFRSRETKNIDDFWGDWESWFRTLAVTESVSLGLLTSRSYLPAQHWISASRALLDAAALSMAALGVPRDSSAHACWHAGVRALESIVVALRASPIAPTVEHHGDPVSRTDFETALHRLAAAGAPVTGDLDNAWKAFLDLRAPYENLLVMLANATMVELGPWLSPASST